jgi:hypothetical protein
VGEAVGSGGVRVCEGGWAGRGVESRRAAKAASARTPELAAPGMPPPPPLHSRSGREPAKSATRAAAAAISASSPQSGATKAWPPLPRLQPRPRRPRHRRRRGWVGGAKEDSGGRHISEGPCEVRLPKAGRGRWVGGRVLSAHTSVRAGGWVRSREHAPILARAFSFSPQAGPRALPSNSPSRLLTRLARLAQSEMTRYWAAWRASIVAK